jgi:hypothetical protein
VIAKRLVVSKSVASSAARQLAGSRGALVAVFGAL